MPLNPGTEKARTERGNQVAHRIDQMFDHWQKGSYFMQVLKSAILTAAVVLAFGAPVKAAGYQLSVIGDAKNFMGCLAVNEDTGLGFMAVGDSVALLGNAKALKIAKGSKVAGQWSVDGAAPTAYAGTSDTLNTVTIDVPKDAEAVAALTTGKTLSISNGSNVAKFDLEGSGEAFSNLVSCMVTKSAP
eukprot:gene5510-5564_t